MSKKSKIIRKVHIHAIIVLIGYTMISKTVFVKSIISTNVLVAYLIPYIFGVIAGWLFLYLFSHEDFFHFMKEVENEEKSKETKYLKRYLHYGKVLATLIIAALGGPIFAALTIRLLLSKYRYKYLLLAIGNITSTLFTVSLARGVAILVF